MVLSIAYFPPISYFSLLSGGDVLLEAHENFQKQSWRNRCRILTANGVENLQVPVLHCLGEEGTPQQGLFRQNIRDIRIDWSRDWLTRHQRAIDSAYMSSAYFEYYRDELYALLDLRPQTLWELDLSLIGFFAGKFGIPMPGQTESFGGPHGETAADIHPKHPDAFYKEKPYFQVFSHRFPFAPNLSVMDLLFNEGPSATSLL